MRRFTPAHRTALEWLPGDGSWARKPGRLSAAINSLGLYHKDLIDIELGDFGPRGGREFRYRLTPAGRQERAFIKAEGRS
jgi:hypothetical protein